MPIFNNNGKKQNVQDVHVKKYMELYPDATTIMEREGKKYRVKAKDYNTFLGDTLQTAQETPKAAEVPQQQVQQTEQKPKGGANGYTFTAEELGIEEPEKAVEPTEESKKRIMAYSFNDKSINPFILPSENHDVKDPYLREAMSARKQIADKEKYIHTLGNAVTEADREELQRLKEVELAALHDSEHAVGVDANPFGQVVGAVTYPMYKLVEGVGDVLGNKSINKFGKQSAERAVALIENRTINGRPALENEWLDLRNNALYKNGKDGDLTILGTVLQSTEELAAGLTDPVYRAADWIGEKTGAPLLEEIGEAGRANIDEIYENSQYKDNSFFGKFAQLVPQLAGTAASLLTGNPVLAKASMGAMVGSSMGSAAREAEKEGASLLEQFAAAGLNSVIELGTEKFSLGHWLGKIATKVGTQTLKEAGEEVVEAEAEALFKEAKKELGGKITAKTVKEFAKDLVVEGGSEATAEFLQTLVPIIYRDKDKWPTWHEAFQSAWDSAIGGLMMAGTLHGVGSYAQRKANDKRWQEQGFIDAAIVNIKDKKGKYNLVVAEVVGEDENGNISILSENKIVKVSKEDIKTRQQFEYNDFKSNVMSIYRSEGYSQNPELINGNTIALAGKAVNDAKAEVRAALSLNDDVDVDAMIADKEFQGDAKMAVDKYLAEKARYEGMQDRLNEERENEIAEAVEEVDAVMHEDGNVYMTTLPSIGEAIFITGGKVVLDNEGYIDVNQSEGLVALMPNGKKEAIQPGNIREKVSVENAEAQKAAKSAEIDNRYKGQLNTFIYTDKADGAEYTVQLVSRGEQMARVILDGVEQDVPNNFFDEIVAEATAENGEVNQRTPEGVKVKGENEVQPEVAPVVEDQKGDNAENAVESSPTGEVVAPVVEAPKTALEQIPRNEKNVPLYEQVDSELAWDGVVEEAGGNEETAMIAVNSMIADKQDALKKAEKAKAKAGVTISEKIAAENERVANIEKAKADLAKWEEIAGVKAKRAAAQAENVAVPVVEETQTPVVESAPVEDNTPQSQSDSSPTLVEQPTPQATNEMQEADLENAEKGKKGQKAVKPVKETDSSTLSQTSDQVGDQDNAPYTKSDELSKIIFSSAFKDLVGEDGKHNLRITKVDGAKRIVTANLNTENVGGDGLELSFEEIANIINNENWQEKKDEATTSGNKLVTDERYNELKERMKKKLKGQMNIGVDPEILAIGTEMAVYHIEKGARKFADFAKGMIADLGDAIRPYLKAFYNGARELPKIEEAGFTKDMTPYEEVKTFDVANFDKQAVDAMLQDKGTEAFERATKATMDAVERLKANGLDIEVVSQEEADAMMELAEMQKRTAPETASVQDEHQPTVVSSADGAKVLKDLDNAIKEYENKSSYPKTLLGDVAKILNAKKHGSNSQYATFEAVNGKVFTIRLANHNAKVSTFDNHDENEGISIVVTAQDNNGVTNDGNAHLVEFFYDAIKLRKADGKPLVEILKSIKQALYSGEYKDNTGLAVREEVNIPEMMTVFHGSGAQFDKFDHSFMGTGEGNQAFGWGTYVTEVEGIGKQYAEAQAMPHLRTPRMAVYDDLSRYDGGFYSAKQNLLDYYNSVLEKYPDNYTIATRKNLLEDITETDYKKSHIFKSRNLYSVEIPDDNGSNYLHWEERINGEIQERVANGLQNIGFEIEPDMNHLAYSRDGKIAVLNINAKGKDLYAELSEVLGGDKQASLFLSDMGFVGISYPAEAMTGGRADGARNYVIFNEDDAVITNRVEFLRTANGKVYGWAVNGTIYLMPDGINPNTPVHEYAHLWGADVEKNNPKLWNEVVEAMKLSPVWNEVANDANYSNIHGNDSRMASEVLARLSGRENYRRTMEEAEKEIAAERDIVGKVQKKGILNRIKNALKNFWNWVQRNVFKRGERSNVKAESESASEVMPWEEFANSVVGDFYKGKNPNVKESPLEKMFMGEKGAENLDKAEEATTRLDNLNVAREMETVGKEAKAIKLATGWERGADGKWRYETEDAKVNRAAKLYNLETRESYPIARSIEIGRVDDNSTIRLADLVKDDELFKAYPEMEEYFVSFEKMDAGIEGSHSFEEKVIRINKDDIHSLESTLVHEIQHAIQSIEGFAKGGNTSSSGALIKEVLETLHVYSENAAPSLSEAIGAIENGYITRSQHEELVKIAQSHGYDDVVEYVRSLSPYSYYRRLAGEVESRNVEERMGMSPEERRNKLAEETEDVRREDQLFLEENLGVSASEVAEEDIPVESVQTQPMTFKERIINATLTTSAKNKENLALRSDALRMFGQDVANVLKLMGKQREYDKSTVDQLVKLAKMYFKDTQLLGGLTPYQVGRVMTRLNNAVGKRDITDDANELVNILVDAHNKELENMLEKQAKTKAKKVNASGVEVIGKLDKEGQLLLESYNTGKELDLESIDDKIIDLQNEAAEGKAEDAAARIRGLELARQYREEILKKRDEIKGLEQELKSAEQDAKDGAMDRAAYKEFRRATKRAIVESKLEMVDAYHGLIHGLGGEISTAGRRAKLFQQQQIDHVKEIQHNANSDLLGHPAEAQGETPDKWNSSVPRFFMVAMPTFQTMLKFFGEKAADGRGYLYERFIPQHTQASHNEYMGKTEAREKMRKKLTKIFGKKTSIEDFMDMSRKDGAVLEYQEGGEKKTIDLTRGQVLYLYMINKMADGQMKLSRMGITDADVQKMAKELPEEMVRFADWVQEEFLTELREKYNKVHERMFGAPMAAIESYFPIKINKRSRGEKIEPGMNAEDKPSTVTGSVIKRTKNAVAIDLSADAMQVLLGHIDDMENWAAWAEFRRDVKSLLNYRHFQNQVKGVESLRYGSGEKLWKNFVDVANIAAGSFKPSSTAADRAVRNIAKGVVSSKIAFRYFTAVKQILSTPAFWSEVDFGKMMNAYLHQKEAWDWAMKNLPGFSKRWKGRASGNEILLESDADWKVWQNRAVQWLSNEGMRANAFIDALTVATGAKAVFETKYEMFKKAGYSEERAREKALNRAAEAYNESQQSSESAYLSPLQAEATFVSSVLTAYRNSPFGYNRKIATAIANQKKMMKKGFKQESIEYMTKQLMRDGLNEEQAKEYAKSIYRRSVARDAADMALYGFFLNYVWELGSLLIYILGGDDDEKKKDLNVEALIDGAMGVLGSLPAGETLTGAIKAIAEGDVSNFKLPQAVAMQDMETIADLMQTDPVRAAGEVLNILVAMGVGVNPQTFTDMFVALGDTEDFNPREIAMLVLRLINAPNSKLELLEADEAMENYGANIEEITREYAEYQKSKRAPLSGWLYSDESEQKAIERYEKRFKKILDERFESIVENTDEYDMWYENSDPQMKAKLAKLRQKFLEGDKETTMEKLDSIDVTKKVLFGSGYDEINTVYYELSTAEDEDMAMMIDTKLKELQPMMDEYKKLRGDERKAYREENLEQIQFYNRLNAHKNNVNNLKGAMKKKPEEAQEKMEKIRKIRTKAIDLINNYE